MKVVTHAVHFDADQKLLDFIERKLAKLEQFFDRIIGVDVFLKLENSSKVKDKVAEIKLNVPGATIIVKEMALTFEAAVDIALDSLKRQLIKHKEKERA
jgi:putative sigma-54 modulation protein